MTLRLSNRRAVLCATASLAALCVLPTAQAQNTYPNKPIRMVVPFAAGGATDVLARVLGQKMSAGLGQPIVIDNKPGAAGIIGTDAVAKSPADGYTVVLSLSNSLMTNEFLYDKLPYDSQRDLTLVYQIAMAPLVLVVHPGVPVKTGPELLKHAAANKGKLAYGSYGVGAYPHLAGAHMSLATQSDMNHVAYKGEAPMVQDLIGGQIQMAYASALVAKPHIESGKLRAVGVTGERRMSTLPNVPTLAEQGLKDEAYRVTGWLAIAVPANTPKPIVNRLAEEVRKATQQPDVQQRVAAMGFELKDSSPELFAAAYKAERPVWERLIKQSGARLE
ncbi:MULTISPECIES: tripartite tricarboxylate transporter substrate binding protein [unclassified Variovorax]|jgi:tripartite-type tricarboxylate transporter receptor subunit TctC|uniref:Bug family tripartite tricarboxylate transporter substrate binding protein n=1 Tax=unclassified Variovorax TaxID=663243 RepID=UPI0008CB8BD0|nr:MULTISPECIES: tripartite tricarboxylate transporter substrate binding protein [unclassified Variovorax]SEI95184.1 Tripartite-type tricarboxylate transporter, receptor component TctC [Variovorax sp. OK202]SFB86404.1 Tripartite-type tricarboxylate transporter, receptor component TctC [Variovorax sp. OK212]